MRRITLLTALAYIGTDFRQALLDDPVFSFAGYTLAEVIAPLSRRR